MFHLVDGFMHLVLLQRLQTPVAEHARMQEVLIDGGQFVLEDDVEMTNDAGIAFHCLTPCGSSSDLGGVEIKTQPARNHWVLDLLSGNACLAATGLLRLMFLDDFLR